MRLATRTAAWVTCLAAFSVVPGRSQELYRRPSLESLEALADADGVLPQPFLARTNANV